MSKFSPALTAMLASGLQPPVATADALDQQLVLLRSKIATITSQRAELTNTHARTQDLNKRLELLAALDDVTSISISSDDRTILIHLRPVDVVGLNSQNILMHRVVEVAIGLVSPYSGGISFHHPDGSKFQHISGGRCWGGMGPTGASTSLTISKSWNNFNMAKWLETVKGWFMEDWRGIDYRQHFEAAVKAGIMPASENYYAQKWAVTGQPVPLDDSLITPPPLEPTVVGQVVDAVRAAAHHVGKLFTYEADVATEAAETAEATNVVQGDSPNVQVEQPQPQPPTPGFALGASVIYISWPQYQPPFPQGQVVGSFEVSGNTIGHISLLAPSDACKDRREDGGVD